MVDNNGRPDGAAPAPAPVATWAAERLSPAVTRAIDRLAASEDVVKVAVMPDVHVAGDVCNGTVLATGDRIFPQAVGSDIGCGMAAIRFDGEAHLLKNERRARAVLAALAQSVPINRRGRASAPEELPAELAGQGLSEPHLANAATRDGRVQFGTLGRGNHFVELQADEQDQLWLMVHSGSRGLGQTIANWHLARAESGATGLKSFAADSGAGRAYLNDMAWAVSYAGLSRRQMVVDVGKIMSRVLGTEADRASLINKPHNFVRQEQVGDRILWVHRKGAMSAAEGEAGVIPGAMGGVSYHVTGRGNPEALNSCSHGAGRTLSRTEARQRISRREFARQVHGLWYDERQTGALCEEAPSAYKDIRQVMKAQADLVRIERKLRGLLTYKGI